MCRIWLILPCFAMKQFYGMTLCWMFRWALLPHYVQKDTSHQYNQATWSLPNNTCTYNHSCDILKEGEGKAGAHRG